MFLAYQRLYFILHIFVILIFRHSYFIKKKKKSGMKQGSVRRGNPAGNLGIGWSQRELGSNIKIPK